MEKIEVAHQMYRDGRFADALRLYTQALKGAVSAHHRIALYSNRAACYLRLQKFKEAADECGAVLAIDCNHPSALMLRAQTLISLKDYQSALFDVTRLIDIGPSTAAYRDLQSRLRTQMTLAPIPECDQEYDSPPESPSNKALRLCSPTTVLPEPKQEEVKKEAVSKPKLHSTVDYSKWKNIGDDLSDDEEEEDSNPQYRYRLRTVGLRTASF